MNSKTTETKKAARRTKTCPYCGEDILATAKKCKHCGEWLTKGKKNGQQDITVKDTEYKGKVSTLRDDVRIANTQSSFNEQNASALPYQFLAIAIGLGIITKSWWVGGGTFFGLLILLAVPFIGTVICYLLAIAWGVLGYFIGYYLFDNSAGWVIGIFLGLAMLGINISSRNWFNDVNE